MPTKTTAKKPAARSSKRGRRVQIVNMDNAPGEVMRRNNGDPLKGIRGQSGVRVEVEGRALGIDRITVKPDAAFPLHFHEGHHVLYVTEGQITVRMENKFYTVSAGETIYVPAEYPHSVIAHPDATAPATFIAFGYPHHPVASELRMTELADPLAPAKV